MSTYRGINLWLFVGNHVITIITIVIVVTVIVVAIVVVIVWLWRDVILRIRLKDQIQRPLLK